MKKKQTPYLLLIAQMVLSVLFLAGVITGITQSFGVIPAFDLTEPTLKYYAEVLTRQDMLTSIGYSLYIAFTSAVLATVIGTVLCGIFVAADRTEGFVMRIIQFPIAVPHVVAALLIINMCSQNGILARMAYALGLISEQQEFPLLIYNANGSGVILAYLWKEIPFIIFFVIALMANINGRLGEAAMNLGAGKIYTFIHVTLPLCKNAICSGFLIIFVFALGAYELPQLLGATTPKALPVLAYIQYVHPDLKNRPYAMALNGIMIAISLLCAVLYFVLTKENVKKLENYEEK